ncbi:hypothetical protein DFH07DRAFT_942464 [Mycena maculata]|uniref:Uncharacterized protein n=1 Tax=Mycena maculata TaxID=230809 RepID=A0AAD7IRA2_9AGAR|nr:hypothetical protein DFH07DRAFT_942464 [Mycena maculata]
MSASTNSSNVTSPSIGTKLKCMPSRVQIVTAGGVQVAKGLGDSVRGTTMGAIDTVEHRDSSINDEIARRGRMEIEQGIAMIKGRPLDPASQNITNNTGSGAGSGINGANTNATTNSTGFAPQKGQEYAQNSTSNNMHSDLGRGPNAYSGNADPANGAGNSLPGWGSGINGGNANATTNSTGFAPPKGQEYAQNSTTAGKASDQPPQYPAPGGPPPQDNKGGMSYGNPTQMGNRPTTGEPVGGQEYQQRQGADEIPR